NNPALLTKDSTHLAIGLYSGQHPKYGKTLWGTVIMLQYLVEINSLPRTVQPGQILRLQVKVNPGYNRPRLPVTLPSGQVMTYQPLSRQGNLFRFEVPIQQRGRYNLEVLVDQPGLGPRVASIL